MRFHKLLLAMIATSIIVLTVFQIIMLHHDATKDASSLLAMAVMTAATTTTMDGMGNDFSNRLLNDHRLSHSSSSGGTRQVRNSNKLDIKTSTTFSTNMGINTTDNNQITKNDGDYENPEYDIKLLMSPEEQLWIQRRGELFDSWHKDTMIPLLHQNAEIEAKGTTRITTAATTTAPESSLSSLSSLGRASLNWLTTTNHDQQEERQQKRHRYLDEDGPWLDFVIIGNP
jgi:hypothetical protein